MISVTRADRSRFTEWYFTVDWPLLTAVFTLLGVGLLLSLSASPAVAINKELATFFFFQRHLIFAIAAIVIVLATSLLGPRQVRQLALFITIAALAALPLTLAYGPEIKGAQRWLIVAGLSIQPSEVLKPAFVVFAAWLFAEVKRRPDMPALPIASILLGLALAGLTAQPDIGQAGLLGATWGLLYILSGAPMLSACVLAVSGLVGVVAAYFTFPHVAKRLDAFFAGQPAANSQADRAMQSFIEGGFFGRGPGEGMIKTRFPDAHTDFIFAVIAEEFGVLACLFVLALFAFIVVRALLVALQEQDEANRLAIQGLALIFGLQALINMAVNVGLLPATGMTLPYVSAGGSSHVSISVTLGFLLALTRRRATSAVVKQARFFSTTQPSSAMPVAPH
ncbi:MAG: putative peptidoglycan glycosyltransferase FtsW [Pseudomonadota bacterium]